MATREYRAAVGTDLNYIVGNGWHIAGITIDNPSGSWLRVTGIEQFVPPYTIGWQRSILPQQASVSVLFVASPSGTPSTTLGEPITVRVSDVPLPEAPGYNSGAEEIQTAGKGNIQHRFDVILATEVAATNVTITPAADFRIVPLRWQVYADSQTAAQAVRGFVFVRMIDGIGADLFPGAVINPSHPVTGWLFPTPRTLGAGASIDIDSFTEEGAGKSQVISYLEFYSIRENP